MNFNPNTDFVILPEIWAHFASDFLIKKKIKYSIFVQGFYHMNSFYDHKKLFESYRKSRIHYYNIRRNIQMFGVYFPK